MLHIVHNYVDIAYSCLGQQYLHNNVHAYTNGISNGYCYHIRTVQIFEGCKF